MQKEVIADAILNEIFSDRLSWVRPNIERPIGPQYPEVFDEFELARTVKISRATSDLVKHSRRNLLDSLHHYQFTNSIYDKKHDHPCKDIQGIILHVQLPFPPMWYEGGFGSVEKMPDKKYWASIAKFTLKEAVCLSLGFDPSHNDDLQDTKLSESDQRVASVWEFFRKRQSLIERRFPYMDKKFPYIMPSKFVDWVDKIELDTDLELIASIKRVLGVAGPKGSEHIDQREKTSLLQVIALMSKDGYRYNEVGRSTLPTELHEAAQLNDEPITKETIRKHLKSAAAVLKGPWKVE